MVLLSAPGKPGRLAMSYERMSFWAARRVMVTGGGGFCGSFVIDRLQPTAIL